MADNRDQKEPSWQKRLQKLARQAVENDEAVNAAYDVSEPGSIDAFVNTPPTDHSNEVITPASSAPQAPVSNPFDNVSNAWGVVESPSLTPKSNEPPKSIFSDPSLLENEAKPTQPHLAKPAPNYRQRRVDRVSDLLGDRYRRITNEVNSRLLVDTYSGDVLPEIVDAIAAPIATQYRWKFGAEVSKSEIRRALDYFGETVAPWEAKVFFGRAGYDPERRQRYIDAGPGNCLTFDNYASYYRVEEGQPRIRPTQSQPLPNPTNIGNWSPNLVNSLFDHTVLPRESDLLLISWMILSWMPDRKQVMLELLGAPSASLEQAHALVSNVVDPATVAWQNELPSNVKQFNDLALKHYLLSFNQVDALKDAQQKHIFNLMRGKPIEWKWKGKTVVANITVQCPVILNSLESVADKSNLTDATLSVEVEEDVHHHAMRDQISSVEPAVVAGLLMIFGHVNAQWETVEYEKRFERYGGLADLCRVGELVAASLGRGRSMFWEQFDRNQQGRRGFELEETPVAQAVLRALDDAPGGALEMPVKHWLAHLQAYQPKGTLSEQWPTSSKGLGSKFKMVKPLLRDVGITLTSTGQRGPLRYWRAEKVVSPSANE